MKQLVCAVLVLALLASSSPAWAQQPQTRMRNGKMAFAGLITMVVGGALMTPVGDSYRVLGDDFCVNRYSVDYGKCSVSDESRRLGLFVLAAGGAMTAFGLSRVKVSPTYKGAQVSTTFTW